MQKEMAETIIGKEAIKKTNDSVLKALVKSAVDLMGNLFDRVAVQKPTFSTWRF